MAHLNYITEFYPNISYPERMSMSRIHHNVSMLNRPGFLGPCGPPSPGSEASAHRGGAYRYDIHIPNKLTPSSRQRRLNRFKTQPVTFDEIKEVDEEGPGGGGGGEQPAAGDVPPHEPGKETDAERQRSERLKSHFAEFSKTMEELVNLKFDESTAEQQHKLFAVKRAQRHSKTRRSIHSTSRPSLDVSAKTSAAGSLPPIPPTPPDEWTPTRRSSIKRRQSQQLEDEFDEEDEQAVLQSEQEQQDPFDKPSDVQNVNIRSGNKQVCQVEHTSLEKQAEPVISVDTDDRPGDREVQQLTEGPELQKSTEIVDKVDAGTLKFEDHKPEDRKPEDVSRVGDVLPELGVRSEKGSAQSDVPQCATGDDTEEVIKQSVDVQPVIEDYSDDELL